MRSGANQPGVPKPLKVAADGRAVWLSLAVAQAHGLGRDAQAVARLAVELITDVEHAGVAIKSGRRSTVWRCERGGRAWTIKRIARPAWQAAVYQMARATQAWREWQGAQRLAAAGRRANPPLALIHDRGGVQWLVLPFVEGDTLDAIIQQVGPAAASLDAKLAARRRLAQAVGGQLGAMTAAGLFNRDAKPSNLIVDAACLAGDAEPVIIDPVGIGRRRGAAQIETMLMVMMRAAWRVGPVRPAEALAAVQAMCDADPSLLAGQPRRVKTLARQVQARLEVFYREHDPIMMHRLDRPVPPGGRLGPAWPAIAAAPAPDAS